MIGWLSANLGTIVAAVILMAVVGLILYRMIKDKKEGRSSCGHGCQNCAMKGTCHRK